MQRREHHLFFHLQDAHPDLLKEAAQDKTDISKGKEPKETQPTLNAVIEKGRQYYPKSLPVKELDRTVAHYKDMQPYSIVKSPGFRALVKS